jgi:hypothetical protein
MSHLSRTAPPALLLAALAAFAFAGPSRAADAVQADPGKPLEGAPTAAGAPSRAPQPIVTLAASTALDGIWMFDAAHSDDPMKVMQASRPQGGAEGGGRMGGGGGGFGGGPPGGGEGGGFGGRGGGRGGRGGPGMGGGDDAGGDHPDQPSENRPRGVSPMGRIMRPARKIVIDMQANQVNVTEDDHAARPYAIADSLKAHSYELLTENTSAKWKNGRLEMTQTMGERGKVVEVYELSADGKTLTIRAHREGGREGMPNPVLTRVYTRYDGE